MNKTFVSTIILLCVLGISITLYLTHQHYKLKQQTGSEKSFCTINEYIDCDKVNLSSYSEFLSVPVAGFGFLYYLIILVFSLVSVNQTSSKKQLLFFSFYLSLFAFLVCLVMAYLAFIKIKALCLLCVAMYIIILIIFILIPRVIGFSVGEMAQRTSHYLKAIFNKKNSLGFQPHFFRYFFITLVFFLSGMLVFAKISETAAKQRVKPQQQAKQHHDEPPPMTFEQMLDAHFEQPVLTLQTGNRPAWGNPRGKVTVIEFSDFQCPFCQKAASLLKTILSEYKNDVGFYFVNYPLDSSCNPQLKHPMHPQACYAAKAALCSVEKDLFWPYHDLIFKNQDKLSVETLLEYAKSLGLDSNWLSLCMKSPEADQAVKKDLELGKEVQVSGTPTIFLNGRRLNGWTNVNLVKAIIEEELQK